MSTVIVMHNPHPAREREPNRKQIAATCAEIQSSWDDNTRRARWLTARVLHGHDFMVQEAWELPAIRSELQ